MGLNNLTSDKAVSILIDVIEYHKNSVGDYVQDFILDEFQPDVFYHTMREATAQWAIATGILGAGVAPDELANSGVWQSAFENPDVHNLVNQIIENRTPPPPPADPPPDVTPNPDPPPQNLEPDPAVQSMWDKRNEIWGQYSADWLQMALEIIRSEEGKTNTQPFNLLYEAMNREYARVGILDYLGDDYYLVINGAKSLYDEENGGGTGELGAGDTTNPTGADPGNPEDPFVELDLPPWAQGLEGIITAEEIVLANQGSEAMQVQVIAVLLALSKSGDVSEVDAKMYKDRAEFLASQWGVSLTSMDVQDSGEPKESNIQQIAKVGLIGWISQAIFRG